MAKRTRRDDVPEDVVSGALDVLGKDLPDTAEDDDAVDGQLVDDDDYDDDVSVPEALVFRTRPREESADEVDEDDVLAIDLDGQKLYAMKPAPAAWTLVLSAVSQSATQADKAHALMQFVHACFDEAGRMVINHRMLDASDDFDINLLSDIINQLIMKWAPEQTEAQRRQALLDSRRRGNEEGNRAHRRSVVKNSPRRHR